MPHEGTPPDTVIFRRSSVGLIKTSEAMCARMRFQLPRIMDDISSVMVRAGVKDQPDSASFGLYT